MLLNKPLLGQLTHVGVIKVIANAKANSSWYPLSWLAKINSTNSTNFPRSCCLTTTPACCTKYALWWYLNEWVRWVTRMVVILTQSHVHCMSRSEATVHQLKQLTCKAARVHINIRQWEYVQNSSHALVLVCSQYLFQYWPVFHGLITQAIERMKSFQVRFFQSIKWCCDTHWSQNASMTMFGLPVVWYTKPEGKQGHTAECISLHLHTNHCCAYLAASLELASVKRSIGKQRLQVAQGRCKCPPSSRAEKVLCV